MKLLSSAFSLLNNVKEYRQAEIAKCDCAIQPYPWASYSTAKVGKVIEEGTTWNVVLAQKKHTWQHCFFSRKLSKQLLEDCRPTYLYFLKHNCNISLFLQSVQPSCTSQYSHQKLLALIRVFFFFLYYIAFIFSWCKTFCDVLKGFFCCLESPLGAKVYNCTEYTSIQL